jgi:hypothetical protein
MPKQSTRSRHQRAEEFPQAKPILVVIHGAGKWQPDYANNMVDAMQKLAQKKIEFHAACYGDMRVASVRESAKAQRWLGKLVAEFERAKAKRAVAQNRLGLGDIPIVGSINALVMLKHVAAYLGDKAYAAKMRKVLRDQLKVAQASGKPIVLVSHSLGSVIAYDVLRKLDFEIARWYTVGCPLDKLVRIRARTSRLGKIPRVVASWHNLYDTHDWVANELMCFKFNIENREVETADTMPAAHDYFDTAEPRKCYADVFKGNQR